MDFVKSGLIFSFVSILALFFNSKNAGISYLASPIIDLSEFNAASISFVTKLTFAFAKNSLSCFSLISPLANLTYSCCISKAVVSCSNIKLLIFSPITLKPADEDFLTAPLWSAVIKAIKPIASDVFNSSI